MNVPVDTLVCDTARIAAWQQDSAFDYNRELIEPQQNILQWIFEVIMGLLSEVINSVMRNDVSWVFITVGLLLLLGVIGWLLYKFRPGLFGKTRQRDMEYEIEDDNIYGIDFEKCIAEALGRHDFREAVRLKYLQTLKLLTEDGRIDWQLHKTPTQYTYEYTEETFLRMTNHFLRIRYGNFEATPEVYEELAVAYSSLSTLATSFSRSARDPFGVQVS